MTPSENAALVIRLEERAEDEYLAQVFKAMMLAPSLEVCIALLRGEKVPKSRLDPLQARAYGLL